MTKRKPAKFTVFLWHRRIGLAALLLVIILAVTGILLNHTEQFKLDETYVSNSWLLSWYGIESGDEPVSYLVVTEKSKTEPRHIISTLDNQLFFDAAAVATIEQNMHGAIIAEEFIVVALDNELILLSFDGELIERISTSLSFGDIQRLGKKYDRPVIETSDALFYMADEHILDWDVIFNDGIQWAEKYKLDDNEKEKLLLAYRGNGLKLERIILDLHSGRIFGHYGVYLMDAAAFALLWLSLSGLWVWSSRRRKMRNKRHYQKHHKEEV